MMLKNCLFKMIYGYELEENSPDINDRLVVAGDPACNVSGSFRTICLPNKEAISVCKLKEYEVRGFSMYPCGISDSDHIYVRRGIKRDELKAHDFIMIKVNQHDYQEERIHFNHKLRRFLMNVNFTDSLEDIVIKLKDIQPEILLDSYKRRLEKKYQKSKERFYNVDRFSLSFTFKDGVMTYSFHPSDDIEGRIEYIYSREKEILKKSSDFEPCC